MSPEMRKRIAVGLLSLSAAGFATWQASEGLTTVAVIPTKGDVPTIGHGSTRYEDGSPVRMGDTITPARAEVLARNLNSQAEKQFAASLPGVKLYQDEFDIYMDFVGQYGIGTWRNGSPRRDLLAGNYAQACHDLLKAAPPKEDDIDPFNPEEQQAVLGALSGQARNMMQFALWTGLRTSELVALDWGDIDWLREEVMVSRAMTQAGKGKAETTKTAAGRRSVKLLRPALEALKAQKTHTFLADAEVFQNPRTLERWAGDGPIRKTMWVPAMKKAGVRYRRPYQTRHTYASMMLSAGEHPMWVAKQMGHTDWTMIARVYGRWMPSADEIAGQKATALFDVRLENTGSK